MNRNRIDYLKRKFSSLPSDLFLETKTNRGYDIVMVLREESGYEAIDVFDLYHYNASKLEVRNAQIWFAEEGVHIIIKDITNHTVSDLNKGYGSSAMLWLKEIAQARKITAITGTLSSVDSLTTDRRIRRDGFYKKHGFTISYYNEQKEAIEAEIKYIF